MNKLKISKCKCGAEVEFGVGVYNHRAVGWQTYSIPCPNRCGYHVLITIDSDSPENIEGKLAEENVIKMWNTIQFSS